jgi:hypothetical protein
MRRRTWLLLVSVSTMARRYRVLFCSEVNIADTWSLSEVMVAQLEPTSASVALFT